MKKAINAWSVEDSLDFRQTFAAVKNAGFDGIELNVDDPGKAHGLSLETTEAELDQIAALSREFSLPVVSISSSLYRGRLGGSADDDASYAQTVLRKQIACAKALDAGAILVVPGADMKTNSWAAMKARAIDTLRAVAEEVEQSGITVGLENVWNGFFMSPYDMLDVIRQVGSKSIRAYFDAGNVAAFSLPEHWIEVLGDQICRVHVKGYASNGFNRGGAWVDLLDGTIDWKKVVDALRKIGFDGYLTAEVFPYREYADRNEFYRENAQALAQITAL